MQNAIGAVRHMSYQTRTGRALRAQQGFTLLEVLVVIAILGMLAAMIVPNVMGRSESARVDMARINMQSIGSALNMYRLDNGGYPSTQEGLRALVERPSSARNWKPGGYLDSVPRDPWGNEYRYISPGSSGPFDLYSLGANGSEGGEGYDAEIHFRESRDG